jgi:hypothetical protein
VSAGITEATEDRIPKVSDRRTEECRLCIVEQRKAALQLRGSHHRYRRRSIHVCQDSPDLRYRLSKGNNRSRLLREESR